MSARAQQLRATVGNGAAASVLDGALARLGKAIDGLEAALDRRETARNSAGALEEELQVLFEDRARLADELDGVKARAARLDAVSSDVAGRLDAVIADIGTVLGGR
jgi:hypothetical protein